MREKNLLNIHLLGWVKRREEKDEKHEKEWEKENLKSTRERERAEVFNRKIVLKSKNQKFSIIK